MHVVPVGEINAAPARMDPVQASVLNPSGYPDTVELSEEALARLRHEGPATQLASAMSLEQIEARIQTVRAQIATIWNSALPDDEKYRLITSHENEIALLQAGQFAFAKAGFSRMV